ncbi:TRAP transporter small permease [uncultured Planococcus sp.]|uniref:TRAP transporter small permease n=1 Tax=uncultured Planococcus sp. TaxID=337815 RepID=UPI002620B1FB|nr:TRAP transporter small permease [uncultured Planococcus sp.]
MLKKYLQFSAQLQNIIVTGLLILLSSVVFIQVVARKLMPVPIPWTEEVAKISLLWITYLGLAATFQQNYHIRIDLLDAFLNTPRKKKAVDLFIQVLGTLFAAALVYLSFSYFQEQLEFGQRTNILRLPMWLVLLPLIVGGVLTLVHFLIKIIESIREMRELK